MRNVIYAINLSIDGCCDHTNFNPSEELFDYFTQLMHDTDIEVYGRITYELMVPYWPDVAKAPPVSRAEHEFARTLDAIDKVVFSRTLASVEGNARIVRAGLPDEIHKLKQQPGKKISISGVNLVSQLIPLGLIDEFYLVIHPVVVGEGGRRLFDSPALQEKLNLKLVDTKVFKSGCIGLHYVKQ